MKDITTCWDGGWRGGIVSCPYCLRYLTWVPDRILAGDPQWFWRYVGGEYERWDCNSLAIQRECYEILLAHDSNSLHNICRGPLWPIFFSMEGNGSTVYACEEYVRSRAQSLRFPSLAPYPRLTLSSPAVCSIPYPFSSDALGFFNIYCINEISGSSRHYNS